MGKSTFSKIYKVTDLFTLLGLTILFMPLVKSVTNYDVNVQVDTLNTLFSSLFSGDLTGNTIAFLIGFAILLFEKYIRFGTLGINLR